jgi:hypothetical protein
MDKSNKNKVICILGMHRSGTSLVARLLNICGVALGESEELLSSNAFNRMGYWENKRVIKINDEILKAFGGSWDNPPKMPLGWERSQRINNLRVQAYEFAKKMSERYEFWAFKEPRTCLLLPFWKSIIPEMIYIIPMRYPEEIADSIRRRNKIPLSKGLILTKIYWEKMFVGTHGEHRYFVNLENLFSESWQHEMNDIMTFINPDLEWNINKTSIGQFIKPSLMRRINKDHRNLSGIVSGLNSGSAEITEKSIAAIFSLLCDAIYKASQEEMEFYRNHFLMKFRDTILKVKNNPIIHRIKKYIYL